MTEPQKSSIETIKTEAKQYYKWKKMRPRYVLVWFLLIIIALQFLLPRQQKDLEPLTVENSGVIVSDTTNGVRFNFLDQDLDLAAKNKAFQLNLDKAIVDVGYSSIRLYLLYNESLFLLPSLEQELKEEKIPADFKYLLLLNNLNLPILDLNIEIQDKYALKINEYIDERMNYKIAKNASIEYLKYLYKDFKDRNLVLLAYFMGSDELKSTMMDQDQKDFDDLYIPLDISTKYFRVMWYKYVFDNISKYINTNDIIPYIESETTIVKLWETKDLIKWANKEWYTFKEIKELNPRILGSSLPKWKWEIMVYKK